MRNIILATILSLLSLSVIADEGNNEGDGGRSASPYENHGR